MSQNDWIPEKYLQFQQLREQPIRDLLARIVAQKPQVIVDLGCGPGNSTALLKRVFPHATLNGVDSSPAMIKKAAETLSGIHFVCADATAWLPSPDVDLVFSNAMFQWLPAHETHLVRILQAMMPGACLAVQMPDNLGEPSHRLMVELAGQPAWREKLREAAQTRSTLLRPPQYHDILQPFSASLAIWKTTYFHNLNSHADIADLLSSTGLKPYLDALSDTERPAFLKAYVDGLRTRYPLLSDGTLLYAFPRLFMVALRAGT
jgi:trans-aconitate 2-methyltransferase